MSGVPDAFVADMARAQDIVDRLLAESRGLEAPAVYVAIVLGWAIRQLDTMDDDDARAVYALAETVCGGMEERVHH